MWQSIHQLPPKSSKTFLCCLPAVASARRMSCTALASALYNCGLGLAGACSGTRLNCAVETAAKSKAAIRASTGRCVIQFILVDEPKFKLAEYFTHRSEEHTSELQSHSF